MGREVVATLVSALPVLLVIRMPSSLVTTLLEQTQEEAAKPKKSLTLIGSLLESGNTTLSKREREALSAEIHKNPVLGGNTKVERLGAALAELTKALDAKGFILDMVPGDILMGPKGSRTLSFRRANPPGSDIFDEQPEMGSRISFNWEDLNASSSMSRQQDRKRYEVVCYLT